MRKLHYLVEFIYKGRSFTLCIQAELQELGQLMFIQTCIEEQLKEGIFRSIIYVEGDTPPEYEVLPQFELRDGFVLQVCNQTHVLKHGQRYGRDQLVKFIKEQLKLETE
jgi:hypothetical protein